MDIAKVSLFNLVRKKCYSVAIVLGLFKALKIKRGKFLLFCMFSIAISDMSMKQLLDALMGKNV